MSGKGKTIYRRPKTTCEECDPDTWEDYIICDAYDKAANIRISKNQGLQRSVQLHERQIDHQPCTGEKQTNSSAKPECASVAHINKLSRISQDETAVRRWKPDDKCIALYNGDGLYYNSKIISVNEVAGSCLVEFDGYGNREVVNIDDIKSESEYPHTKDNISPNTSCHTSNSSLSSTDGTSSDVMQDIYQSRGRKKKRMGESKHCNFNALRCMDPPSFNPVIATPPPLFMPQGFPQPFANFRNGPAESISSKLKDLSDDALSSMLMSWYMAGYHTGYYQGLASKTKRSKR